MDHHVERNPKATIADVFGFAVTAFLNNPLLFIGLQLLIWGVFVACAGIGVAAVFGAYGISRIALGFSDLHAFYAAMPAFFSLGIPFFGIAWTLFGLLLVGALYLGAIQIAFDVVDTGTSSWNRITSQIAQAPSFIVSAIIKGFIISLGFVFFVVPGIYLTVLWFFSWYILVAEQSGPLEALYKSAALAKGRWWQIAGFVLISQILWLGGYQVVILQIIISPIVLLAGAYYYRALAASLVSQRS